ncbi:MAG: hypothetical protein ACI9GW_000535 [Halieaceae bacterium]|jgi:hypothetical protein
MAVEDVKENIADSWDGFRDRFSSAGSIRGWVAAIGVYLIVAVAVGIYWSGQPDAFEPRQLSGIRANVVGSTTTLTLMKVTTTLLDKPGGYLTNDIFPPGVWLDNIPNWEFGALQQLRDLTRVMRESISRSQSQSREDPDLALAGPRFFYDHKNWALPASESEYRDGIRFLESYHKRLIDSADSDAQFYARADNLRVWLGSVESRLGSLSQRLTASVGQRRLNTDLAGDSAATQATAGSSEMEIKTPWTEIDDVFFEARGSTWALIHFLKAIEVDFADVLAKKNAKISVQQIVRELEATQESVYSPIILNGGGFGFVANHSLTMASYISRANAAIIDLRDLLSQG